MERRAPADPLAAVSRRMQQLLRSSVAARLPPPRPSPSLPHSQIGKSTSSSTLLPNDDYERLRLVNLSDPRMFQLSFDPPDPLVVPPGLIQDAFRSVRGVSGVALLHHQKQDPNKLISGPSIDTPCAARVSGFVTPASLLTAADSLGLRHVRVEELTDPSLSNTVAASSSNSSSSKNKSDSYPRAAGPRPSDASFLGRLLGIISPTPPKKKVQDAEKGMPSRDEAKTSPNISPSGSRSGSIEGPTVPKKVFMRVGNMTCASCSTMVETGLRKLPGVLAADVSLLAGRAEITYVPGLIEPSKISDEIDAMGYEPELLKGEQEHAEVQLSINGMTCASCSSGIEAGLLKQRGVLAATVNLLASSGRVEYDPLLSGPRDIVKHIEDLGYDAEVELPSAGTNSITANYQKDIAHYRSLARISLIFAVPVFLLAMVFPMIPKFKDLVESEKFPGPLLQALLCAPVQFYVGRGFYTRGWKSIQNRSANMDVLVALGTSAAYFYSLFQVVFHWFVRGFHQELFFDTSSMLISIILIGKLMETVTKGRTADAISKLPFLQASSAQLLTPKTTGEAGAAGRQLHEELKASLLRLNRPAPPPTIAAPPTSPLEVTVATATPSSASSRSILSIIQRSGFSSDYNNVEFEEQSIKTDLVQVGDILKVLPGGKVPVDGVVLWGHASINESMLTGEPVPVNKSAGDVVIGATVNEDGMFHMLATRVGQNTTLSQIIRLVQEAQTSKPQIQVFADSVSRVFVPIVVLISLFTFMVWFTLLKMKFVSTVKMAGTSDFLFAFLFAVSVLVVACPCALGLATPTALMVATGVAVGYGILLKTGQSLESTWRAKDIIFDKTGTLTVGKPSLASYKVVRPEIAPNELLKLAASAENCSEHPIATAIVEAAKSAGITVQDPLEFTAVVGLGVSAVTFGHRVLVGSASLLEEKGVPVPPAVIEIMTPIQKRGSTAVLVAVDAEVWAVLEIMDAVKPEARTVVKALQRRGLRPWIVTGDNEKTAQAVAAAVGIKDVRAGCRPQHKAQAVREIQDLGRIVLMVGDGINDAPALSQADVGIAIGSGTDIAAESADVVLIRSDLRDLIVAIDLSAKTFNRIRANMFFSLVYNVLSIPLAAGLFYPLLQMPIPPLVASVAMALSSISVVTSSLLLRRYRPPSDAL